MIGRCGTCRFWGDSLDKHAEEKDCQIINDMSGERSPAYVTGQGCCNGFLVTKANFGCTEHEERKH